MAYTQSQVYGSLTNGGIDMNNKSNELDKKLNKRLDKKLDLQIVIPVYNGEKYIDKCVKNIISGVDDEQIKYEILIINDGSTDRTADIISEYDEDSRIRIINTENHGVQAARNLGIAEAYGSYIYFMDVDDIVYKDILFKAYHKAVEFDADIALANYVWLDEQTGKKTETKTKLEDIVYSNNCSNISGLLHTSPVPCNRLIRRELLIDNDIKFPILKIGEDAYIHYTSLAVANKIVTMSGVIYAYVQHEGSACHTYDSRIMQITVAFNEVLDFYKKHKIDKYINDIVEDKYFWYNGWIRKLLRYKTSDNQIVKDILGVYEKDYSDSVREYGLLDQALESKFGSKWVYENSLIRWTFQKLKSLKNNVSAA